ncbi:alpha-L-rhamnosidase [Streptomyces tsukubensis]|uniref:alpha-L-rhamnosidase n=1 Tax=Streptomyces tsukubensis TaxID=83656 RepID=A0A1V4A084_9ACTN|nr:alpha-L-rhamnosidase [Streptomyces tsukubensis]OON71877.1 rhamnosidase [Streptomyces tsukubensis]QFR91827.1 Bacterial alpha-L-rhamnosidase [Streptomyces tsukubensis]
MISRRRLLSTTATALGTSLVAGALPTAARAAGTGEATGRAVRVDRPTVEYVSRPLGISTERPRLSWPLVSTASGQAQRAYQVRVATAQRLLDRPDVWDSGKVASSDSLLVPYRGPELRSRTRYYWSVRVWDTGGKVSAWSTPSWWETGLGDASDWKARWIAAPTALVGAPALDMASWIWFPEGDPASNAPAGTRWFRGTFDVPEGLTAARLVMTADDGCTAYLDGERVLHADADAAGNGWSRPAVADVTRRLDSGPHTLAVEAVNAGESPAGLLGALELTTPEGLQTFNTGDGWRASDKKPADGWEKAGYDDAGWPAAEVVAAWGSGPWGKVSAAHSPVAQLRHAFRLKGKGVARARLYATALGLYEARLNGRRVGEDCLAPGWTDYAKRVQYQTYDVTDLLRPGANALGVELAVGWYAGNVGMFGPHQYGDHPSVLAQLEVTYRDGTTERVLSDTDWKAATGPLTQADLLSGEVYDARLETEGWLRAGFDDSGWASAVAGEKVTAELVAEVDGPCRVERELKTRKVTEPKPGVFVFDLGQNMVGATRLTVSGAAGTTVRLRHAEVLNPDGTVYTTNLRTARATDTYTLKGGGKETYEPRFTFHGFRYVEVTGYPGKPSPDAIVGRVIHTDAPFTMEFETDVPILNQLHSNITWGQRGNFLSVPTDTPARDERLGWTGDINVFAPTATYTMESARFLTKWLRDLRDEQTSEGAFTDVAPQAGALGSGSAGWGDAGVTVPWALYQAYGDTQVLDRSWGSMLKWLDYLEAHSSGRLRPAEGYGDWLNIADDTPKDVIATAYYAHSADLVARTAKVLGKDPAPYVSLFGEVRDAFRAAYVGTDGKVKGDNQTSYVLALSMDLLSDSERRSAADRLVALIEAKDWHLSTGFLGTPRLLPVLTDTGHTDVAYRLLLQKTFPSWGYQIDKGATTMWERWDSIKPDGSFQDAGMNSFNHYAYGCVGEWMYANIAGIAPAAPGFRKVTVRPRPGGGITRAEGRFDARYGAITTAWRKDGDRFRLDVTLPVNTTGEVWIPAGRAADVSHGSATYLRMEDGCAVFAAGSGTFRFSV